MPLFLNEEEVGALLTVPEAMDAVEAAFRAQAAGGASNHARERFFLPRGVFHHMAAALPEKGVMGTKQYTSFAGGTRFWVLLFSSENGDLLAMIEADTLGQVRTGAATGVAARHMARADAQTATLFGAGHQARTQAEAIVAARPGLRLVQVFSRDPVRREAFCQGMTRRTGVRFEGLDSAEAAARGTDIVVCATTATEPVLKADWLSPGDFVAGVGANRLTAREIGEDVVERASVIVVDDLAQARTEAAELIFAHERRKLAWECVLPLSDVVCGRAAGRRSDDEITLFKSLGVALEDVAVAHLVYEKARARGVGREV